MITFIEARKDAFYKWGSLSEKTPDRERLAFYDGFYEGFEAGWDAAQKELIRKEDSPE